MPPTRRRASQARNSASSASSLAINLPARRLHIANHSQQQQQQQPAASLHNGGSYEARSGQALAGPSGSQGQDVGDVESTEHVSLSLSSEVHPTSLHASWQTDAASQGRMLPPPDFAFTTPEMISARGVGGRARASEDAIGSAHPAYPPAARAPPRMLNRHARPRTSSASQAGTTQDSSFELSHLQAMRPPDMDFFSRPAAPPTEAASRSTRARSAQPSTTRRRSGMMSEEPSTSLRSLRGVTASPGSVVRPADSSRDLDASRLSSMARGQATASLASPNLEESELDNEPSLASDPRPFREDPGRTARLHLGLEAAYPRSRRVVGKTPAEDRASIFALPLDPYHAPASHTTSNSTRFPAPHLPPGAFMEARNELLRSQVPCYSRCLADGAQTRGASQRQAPPGTSIASTQQLDNLLDDETFTSPLVAFVGCSAGNAQRVEALGSILANRAARLDSRRQQLERFLATESTKGKGKTPEDLLEKLIDFDAAQLDSNANQDARDRDALRQYLGETRRIRDNYITTLKTATSTLTNAEGAEDDWQILSRNDPAARAVESLFGPTASANPNSSTLHSTLSNPRVREPAMLGTAGNSARNTARLLRQDLSS